MSQLRKTVLIVDDEESVRYVLGAELTQLGYEPVLATGGEEAIKMLAGHHFDVVMLDARMPGMSGLDVLERVRSSHPDTPFIMLSALVDADVASEALKFGADDYLTKPWNVEELAARINKAEERRRGINEPTETGLKADQALPAGSATADVTRDLISQQVTLYERQNVSSGEQEKKARRRSWWPWRK